MAAVGDTIHGFCHFRLAPDAPDAGEVLALYLTPEVQGLGVGKRLLTLAEDAARAAGCERVVLSATRTGLRFYLAQGYREVPCGQPAHVINGVPIPCTAMAKALRGAA